MAIIKYRKMTPLTLLSIGLLGSASLVGCQALKVQPTSEAHVINADSKKDSWSISIPQPRLLQTITKYEWQLTQITDANHTNTKNKAQRFKFTPPLIMEVRPDRLLFKQGCQRYQASFHISRLPPYPYSVPDKLTRLSDDCGALRNTATTSTNDGAIYQAFAPLFEPYSGTYFGFEPMGSESALFSKILPKKLSLKTDKGTTLTFTGTAKPKQKTLGLPITNSLLERYQWHLISAVDDNNHPIQLLSQPNIPITANFYTNEHSQSIGFFSGCNGVGGSYTLSVNHTLFIGAHPQTLLGCSNLLEAIEDKVSSTLLRTKSQLILNLIPTDSATITDASAKNMSAYLLTQKLSTGETLIWENEALERR